MYVDAAEPRCVQHDRRQNQAVGDHHHDVGAERFQLGLRFGVAQRCGLQHRQRVGQRQLLDRAGGELFAASGRAIRLGVNGDHFAAIPVQQGLQVFRRKGGCAGENDAQRVRICHRGDQALWRCCFSSFLRMRVRFSGDR